MRRKLRFKTDCQKFSLETLLQSISQPHKISPLHFHNIREVVNYPNQSSSIRFDSIRFDSIRFSLYSTRFDSVHFFKFGIRFDSIRLNRIELFDNSIRFRSLLLITVDIQQFCQMDLRKMTKKNTKLISIHCVDVQSCEKKQSSQTYCTTLFSQLSLIWIYITANIFSDNHHRQLVNNLTDTYSYPIVFSPTKLKSLAISIVTAFMQIMTSKQ